MGLNVGSEGYESPADREAHLCDRIRQLAEERREAERVLIDMVKERDAYRAALADLVAALGPEMGAGFNTYARAVAILKDGP